MFAGTPLWKLTIGCQLQRQGDLDPNHRPKTKITLPPATFKAQGIAGSPSVNRSVRITDISQAKSVDRLRQPGKHRQIQNEIPRTSLTVNAPVSRAAQPWLGEYPRHPIYNAEEDIARSQHNCDICRCESCTVEQDDDPVSRRKLEKLWKIDVKCRFDCNRPHHSGNGGPARGR